MQSSRFGDFPKLANSTWKLELFPLCTSQFYPGWSQIFIPFALSFTFKEIRSLYLLRLRRYGQFFVSAILGPKKKKKFCQVHLKLTWWSQIFVCSFYLLWLRRYGPYCVSVILGKTKTKIYFCQVHQKLTWWSQIFVLFALSLTVKEIRAILCFADFG